MTRASSATTKRAKERLTAPPDLAAKPRSASLSVHSHSSAGSFSRMGSFSFLGKKLSFNSSSHLQDAVAMARDPQATLEEKHRAVRQIREVSDRCESMALIRLGVVDILLHVLQTSTTPDDEKMWALYVVLRLVKEPETAVWMLEKPTVDVLEVLSTLLVGALKHRNGHLGTLIVQRVLAVFSTLCKEDMTLALLARPEVFAALQAALTHGALDEVAAALVSYDLLVGVVEPSFLLAVAGTCPQALHAVAASPKMSLESRKRARNCIAHFDAAAIAAPLSEAYEAPATKTAREKTSKWSKFLLETFEGQGPIASRLLEDALKGRDSASRGP